MSTSDRVVVAESAGAAVLLAGATALASPANVFLDAGALHPAWLVVTLMAARYGARGLLSSVLLTWGALALAGLALGNDFAALVAHTHDTTDLFAIIGATVVAWIAMLHESRLERADRKLAEALDQQRQADSTVKALHDSLGYLRARHDRVDISLSLWRDLSGRIEKGDANEAAAAILELCEIRTGCSAGIVQLRDGHRLTTLANRGQWSPTSVRPTDITIDRTVRSAIQARRVTPACDGATEDDCDVAVPVLDDHSGVVVGVIALRGVAPGALRAADITDLIVLSQWVAPALGRPMNITSPMKKLGTEGVLQ